MSDMKNGSEKLIKMDEFQFECKQCFEIYYRRPLQIKCPKCSGDRYKLINPRKRKVEEMSKEVQAYVEMLQNEKKELVSEIALKNRSLSRIEEKLNDPEKYFNKELKRGSVKVKKIFGEEPKPNSSRFKKKSVSSVDDQKNDDVPAVAKKDGWGGIF